MARNESQRKFGLPRGRNLPFTLESRKGNYQSCKFRPGLKRAEIKLSRSEITTADMSDYIKRWTFSFKRKHFSNTKSHADSEYVEKKCVKNGFF